MQRTDNVLYLGKQHWIVFVWPGLLLLLGVMLLGDRHTIFNLGVIALFFGVGLGIINALTYLVTDIVVTQFSVTLRRGIIVRQITDIPYNKIESINIAQSILGQLIGYGTLIVIGTGGTRSIFTVLNRPYLCKQAIESAMREQQ